MKPGARPYGDKKALGKTAKKGVMWSFFREGVSELLLFPASMVLARLLSPEEFGIGAAASFFTLLAGRLSELGLNASIVRAKDIRPVHLSSVFVANLTLGVLAFTALFLSAPAVAAFYGISGAGQILRVSAFGFLIAPLGAVPAAMLTRELQFRKTTAVDWCQGLVFASSTLLFAWMGHSYMSLAYGRLASLTTQTGLRIVFARWRPSLRFSRAAMREILPFGLGVHAKRLLDYTAQQGDNLVVGKLLGMHALGLYDKAYSTMNRFLVRMNTGGPNVMFRIFAVIHEEPERFRRAYEKVVMSASLVGFPVFGVLAVAAPQLMVVLFGEAWRSAAEPFRLLCLAGALKLVNAYASAATQAAGRIWSEVWRQALFIALLVGGIFALRGYGPLGAAGGVLLATSIMTVLMHVLLRQVTDLGWGDLMRPLVPASLCASGAVAVAILGERIVAAASPGGGPLLLLVVQAVLAGAFVVSFVLFAPHRRLRTLVHEVGNDIAPARLKRHPWVRAYLERGVLAG